ncbi:ABC transporter substrate-binding protein [Hazenella coriacea]|uniref:Peptide/nickel transport system substrate-binding protein n=1 Tax=Hazenella coriacea TaxID=1179467 RepID=A0A4V2UVX0_9BACL|nr:ABC transporter substrate-binding protein [Hazenella coriacea]TCS96937.1 peptide/nickel transport system substrate-binding protein [Hazenella coriacea]
MKKKYLILSIALLFVFSSILVACGGKKASGDRAKTLVFGRGADSILLDPIQVTDGESIKVASQVFDTLVEYDKGSTKIVPELADSWEASQDGLSWTFKLKQGVKFHDGTPFNAEAVVYNFNRWMDSKHPEHKGGEFAYYAYMFGGFKGDSGHVIKNVVAEDEYTVKFELNFPQGPFLSNLAMPAFSIASPTAVKKDPVKFAHNPAGGGTGPFEFVEWKKNNSITLKKNKNYWKPGLPKLDKVIFKSIPDNGSRFSNLKSGDIDMMDGLNPDDVQLIKSDSNYQLFLQEGMNVGYLAFNVEKEPFNNVKVRQALNYATNKQGIIKSFFADLGTPAVNPMPEIMWGSNKNIKDYEYNIDKAKQLLAEAGYKDGFEVDFYAMTEPRGYMPNGKKVAEYMQADFAKIGVKANIVTSDWQTYKERVGNGEHKMALFGWMGDNGDPDNFLYVLLDKDNARKPDAGNISFYKSEPLHDILIQAQRSSDQKEREQLYMKAQEIIKQDAPWIPLVHAKIPMGADAKLVGFVPHPTGSLNLHEVDFK